MANAVTGNSFLYDLLLQQRATLNGNCSLRLFVGEPDLSPATLPSALVEANFTGYLRKNTVGSFGLPVKVSEGLYQINSDPFLWIGEGDPGDPVTGWCVVLNLKLLFAGLFPVPIVVNNGTPVSLVVQLQEASLSLCNG